MAAALPLSAIPFGASYQRLIQSAWFSYSTILLLQLKVIWGMWRVRDLTSGDTSAYFVQADHWFRYGTGSMVWSPLYTFLYGSLLEFSSDAFVVTTLHRLLIVLILAVLVLALMRKLLPPDLAWLMTAWWVILPINFDAMYEVHLFAVIPVLCAGLIILSWPGHWRYSGALALMLATSLLMRNELLLATGMLTAMMLGVALWNFRSQAARPRLTPRLWGAYAIPLICTWMLTLYCYRHATDVGYIAAQMEHKHTLNICQTYAFGYQQRQADFKKSAWTECQELMTRVFGKPEPSLLEALGRNPAAMFAHFLWNLQLVPSGLQVALFNEASGGMTPDYAPVMLNSGRALFASSVLLIVFAAGLIQLVRHWHTWWNDWLRERIWGWLLLLAASSVTVGVMISQRPRPSYMFVLAILLRAAAGMCLLVLLSKTAARTWLSTAFPALAVAIIFCKQSYYLHVVTPQPRLLLKAYQRVAPFAQTLTRSGTVLVAPGFTGQLCDYVGKGGCREFNYYDLAAEVSASNAWPKVLSGRSVTMVYLDEAVLATPDGQRLVSEAASAAWQTLVRFHGGGQNWMVLARPDLAR